MKKKRGGNKNNSNKSAKRVKESINNDIRR